MRVLDSTFCSAVPFSSFIKHQDTLKYLNRHLQHFFVVITEVRDKIHQVRYLYPSMNY